MGYQIVTKEGRPFTIKLDASCCDLKSTMGIYDESSSAAAESKEFSKQLVLKKKRNYFLKNYVKCEFIINK